MITGAVVDVQKRSALVCCLIGNSLAAHGWCREQPPENNEAGQATEAEHLAAFQKARAANAVLAALEADPRAAAFASTYEAYHATNDLPGLRVVILSALRASP